MSPVSSTMVLFVLFNVLGEAVVDPSGRPYHRLLGLMLMVALLLAFARALGVVWRIQWPQLPELHLPVVMI